MVARRSPTKPPVRIWSFHALAPVAGNELVTDVLRNASRYYNKLIEIERERLREYRETRKFYAPEIEDLEQALGDARASTAADKRDRIASASQAIREATAAFEATLRPARDAYEERTSGAPVELLAELRSKRLELVESKKIRGNPQVPLLQRELDALKERKKKFAHPPRIKEQVNARVLAEMLDEDWPDSWKDLAQADDSAREQRQRARAECQLPPGCYLLVEKAVEAAIADSRPAEPKFRANRGGGRIGVQLTPDLTVADLEAGVSTKFRLRYDPSDPRRRAAVASIRVGSNEDRSPIWADFPVYVDRPLPPDGVIKWAWVKCRSVGLLNGTTLDDGTETFVPMLEFEMQLTLEAESFRTPRRPRGEGTIVFEPCAERLPDGSVRVARYQGSASGEIVVPAAMMDRLRRPALLRGHADHHRNGAYRGLRLFLARTGNLLTGWHRCESNFRREQIKGHARAWASLVLGDEPRKAMWRRWRDERRAAGLDLYVSLPEASRWARAAGLRSAGERLAFWLELWTRKDTHLRRVWLDTMRNAENARNEFFRAHGIELAKRCAVLDAKADLLVPDDEMGDDERALRQLAAAGECRSIVRECCGLSRAPGSRDRERPDDAPKPGGARKSTTRGKSKRRRAPKENGNATIDAGAAA